jgi:phosphate transport system substrate-binding protein
MSENIQKLFYCFFILFVFAGCSNPSAPEYTDTLTTGTIHISVDESFKPVIDSQIKVFEASHPKAKIIAHYKPEAACLKDLMIDSIRMVIVTRELKTDEEQLLKDTLQFLPNQGKMAFDAMAVIVNNQAKDSIFDMNDLAAILKGNSNFKLKPVMDGLTATSNVRFALDSILKNQPFSKEVAAATNSEGVINFVANNTNAIGFIGVSWIGNHEDETQLSFLKKVKIASIRCGICQQETYVKPYQANIATRRYPLVRGLHYILKENYDGLGSGFKNFLIYERGQLIFRRAYLWPSMMSFEVRKTDIKE